MSASSPVIPQTLPTQEQILKACSHVALALGEVKYAVVGGAACQALGSDRVTEDVDFVVPKGTVQSARRLLAAKKDKFIVEPRTLHTYYKTSPPVEIEILSPPGTFKEKFDHDTTTMAIPIHGAIVHILHPVLILNAKCLSILGRANSQKKTADAIDIAFLLQYLVKAGIFPSAQDSPNVSGDFVAWFIESFGHRELWVDAKFNFVTGSFGET